MEQYTTLAYLYDELMNHIDYKKITDYIEKIFSKNKMQVKNILDLGCGTGTISFEFAKRGYQVTGIDISTDMLDVAAQKSNGKVMYLCQDMTSLELKGSYDAFICMFDCLNYVINFNDLKKVFKSVAKYLKKDGIFIFDINTRHKLSHTLGYNTFTFSEDGLSYIWENEYDSKNKQCNFYLTFFVKEGELFRKYEEHHIERAYTIEQIEKAVNQADLKVKNKYKDYTFTKGDEESERVTFVVNKK